MEIIFILILIGLLPAFIASNKGKSFVLWWIYGALLFIVALPHSLIMKKDQNKLDNKSLEQGMKKCAFCAELIKAQAVVCKHCGKDIVISNAETADNDAPAPKLKRGLPLKSWK